MEFIEILKGQGQQFNPAIKKGAMVLFFSDGCGHCNVMKPQWNALQNKDVHKALKLKVSPERVVTELDKMILASFNHSHLSIIEHATMMDSVDGSVDNGETKQLIKPEIILSKLGLHKAIFNRDDCNWNDTTSKIDENIF